MGERIEELKGNIKSGMGKAMDDEALESEGKAQAGAARGARKVKGALEEAGGRIKEAVGTITGNDDKEAEGAADRAKGEIRQAG